MFEPGLGDGFLQYLKQEKEVDRSYEGESSILVSLLGKGMESYEFALSGQNPGCTVIKVAGRKATVMYEQFLAVVVGGKVAVLFSGDGEWPEDKKAVMALASKFDYNKLESLLK